MNKWNVAYLNKGWRILWLLCWLPCLVSECIIQTRSSSELKQTQYQPRKHAVFVSEISLEDLLNKTTSIHDFFHCDNSWRVTSKHQHWFSMEDVRFMTVTSACFALYFTIKTFRTLNTLYFVKQKYFQV